MDISSLHIIRNLQKLKSTQPIYYVSFILISIAHLLSGKNAMSALFTDNSNYILELYKLIFKYEAVIFKLL